MDAVTGDIAFVEVDQAPLRYPSYGEIELTDDFDGLEGRLVEKLLSVASNTDGAHCENPACSNMVGYTLHGDADEIVRWNYTFVMGYGKSTRAVCEDCAAPLTVWMF